MSPKQNAARLFLWLLIVSIFVGCKKEEMPRPPAQQFSNPAEADFEWAMERLEHAIEMFHPPSNLGIRVTRDLDYELFPPNAEHSNYTARVTVTTKTIYSHGKPVSPSKNRREKQKTAEKAKAEQQAKRDPFALPGEDPITGTSTIDDDLAEIEQNSVDIIDPSIPPQEIELKEDFELEYVDGVWKQLNRAEEEHIQLWFDYALQQGEYKPESLE